MISFHLSFDWLKRKLLGSLRWLQLLFITRYAFTVSFNKEWRDADDKSYIAKKIIVQKEKHLKFRTDDNEVVEYRSAAGLNYIIKELR